MTWWLLRAPINAGAAARRFSMRLSTRATTRSPDWSGPLSLVTKAALGSRPFGSVPEKATFTSFSSATFRLLCWDHLRPWSLRSNPPGCSSR